MRVKLGMLAVDAVPHLRGRFYLRSTMWGDVVQTWPRKGKRRVTRQEKWWRDQFALAGRMAANPTNLDYQTAVEMAKGVTEVPRDLLTGAIYGRLYEIVPPEGTPWGVYPHHPPEPGPPPPPPGGTIMWLQTRYDSAFSGSVSGSNNATKGLIMECEIDLSFVSVTFVLTAIDNGATYRATLATIIGGNEIDGVIASSEITNPTNDSEVLTFLLVGSIPAGQRFVVLLTRTDDGPTFSLNIRLGSNYLMLPWIDARNCVAASDDPQSGTTVTSGSTSVPAMALGLEG